MNLFIGSFTALVQNAVNESHVVTFTVKTEGKIKNKNVLLGFLYSLSDK